jgi:hypothetical protein
MLALAERAMARKSGPATVAAQLTVDERLLLLCAASNTSWTSARISGTVVAPMVVKDLVARLPGGTGVVLTPRGRAVLRVLLKDSGLKISETNGEDAA